MTAASFQQTLARAVAAHQANRLPEAESLYRQILAQSPTHADALHLLGMLAFQSGHYADAADLAARAVASAPHVPQFHFDLSRALTRANRPADATTAIRRAIELKPDFAEAHNELGALLARHAGEAVASAQLFDQAIAAFRSALAIRPDYVQARSSLGAALANRGRIDEGIAELHRVISERPDYAPAHNNLGSVLIKAGRITEAADSYRRAIAIKPADPTAHYNLATALSVSDRIDDAIAAARQAITLRPDFPEALNELGVLLTRKSAAHPPDASALLDEAIAAFRRAIALVPNYAQASCNLGPALADRGQIDQAIAQLQSVIARQPDYAPAHNNLGSVLVRAHREAEGLESYGRAIAIDPNYPQAHFNLGSTLEVFHRFDEAKSAYQRAIEIDPNMAKAHWNLGLILLLEKDFARGFVECEWRLRAPFGTSRARDLPQPQWTGSDPANQRILIYAEQGFGDVIHMARYLPQLVGRGAKIILECQRPLHRLLSTLKPAGIESVITQGDPVPDFDFHCAIMSLPCLMGTTSLEKIPAPIPYLAADPALAAQWKARLGDDPRPKVGLTWAGSRSLPDDTRSMSASAVVPLASIPDVRFISMQKGESPIPGLIDWSQDLTDFAETAALIANLDLVITVDTAVAHLAGAMGKPAYVVLSHQPDWRWLLDRDDSPWYPTLRLFRQPHAGDWTSPVRRAADALQQLFEAGKHQ